MQALFGKSKKTLLLEQEYNDAKTWFKGYYASQDEDVKNSISVIPGNKGIPSEQILNLKYNGVYFEVANVVNAFNNAESSNHPAWKQAWKQECINIHKRNMQEYNDAKTWFEGYYSSQDEDVKTSISVKPGDKGIPSEQLNEYDGKYFDVASVVNAFNIAEERNDPLWKQKCIRIYKKNMAGGRKRIFRKKKI